MLFRFRPERIELSEIEKMTFPCPFCLTEDAMTFASLERGRSIPRVQGLKAKRALMSTGEYIGERIDTYYSCKNNSNHNMLATGILDTFEFSSRDTSIDLETLVIDFIAPAPPLFSGGNGYSEYPWFNVNRLFKLYWIDKVSAMGAMRSAAEAVLVAKVLQKESEGNSAFEIYKSILKTNFNTKVDKFFSDPLEKRMINTLWSCGSVHSHFGFDEEAQMNLSCHLDQAVRVLHALLQCFSGGAIPQGIHRELSDLEKFYRKNGGEEARLRRAFGI